MPEQITKITKITKIDIHNVSLVADPINPVTVINDVPQYLAEKYGLIPKEET